MESSAAASVLVAGIEPWRWGVTQLVGFVLRVGAREGSSTVGRGGGEKM